MTEGGLSSRSPMAESTGDDGCPTFQATVRLDLADTDKTFRWGVVRRPAAGFFYQDMFAGLNRRDVLG